MVQWWGQTLFCEVGSTKFFYTWSFRELVSCYSCTEDNTSAILKMNLSRILVLVCLSIQIIESANQIGKHAIAKYNCKFVSCRNL